MVGYKKGIFTGANHRKIGLFDASEEGTVFLDEVGELSPANQAKLLLAVESKIIRQIGSNESKQTNFRILAATNRNIDHMVIQEQFRDDLLQRLNTIRIGIPP
ncbi:MAG: sigma 54-interacting transcriptional regulator [Bacteroidales bacterium]|nr:sigma 54-interacting transcriptional regulator [Bacteroidales bacterium]